MSRRAPRGYRVVLFEDTPDRMSDIVRHLVRSSPRGQFTVERFDGDAISNSTAKKLGGAVVQKFLNAPRLPAMALIDEQLTSYGQAKVDQDEISAVCARLAVPFVRYHLRPGKYYRAHAKKNWATNQIEFNECTTIRDLADRSLNCIRGFIRIQEALTKRVDESLGQTLRRVLESPPAAEVQMDLYFWGSLQPIQIVKGRLDERIRLLATVLGYWIFNALLPFPGVLLSRTAAASYLDIDPVQFGRSHKLRGLFAQAKYRGPFGDLDEYWWGAALDEVLADGMVKTDTELVSGNVLARRKGFRPARCRCMYNNHEGAGFYCIINDRPVCAEHSVQPPSWLPMGANRSRIESSTFEELTPWLKL